MPFTVAHPPDTAPLQEGEPFYTLTRYTYKESNDTSCSDFSFDIRAFKVLPPSDAVGLLNGHDETGLIVWAGSLGLLTWMLTDKSRLRAAVTFADAASGRRERLLRVLELGSGSGVLAVALHHLLLSHLSQSMQPDFVRVDVVATDGNESCVSLARRNLLEQCGTEEVSTAVRCRVAQLQWGCPQKEFEMAVGDMTAVDRLLLVSGDVIYDSSAVPLLLTTAESALHAFLSSRKAGTPVSSPHNTFLVEWWLLYIPRSLTRDSNIAIYKSLRGALAAHYPFWRVEQLPLPPGCFTSAFAADEAPHSACEPDDPFALLGCLFVVRML